MHQKRPFLTRKGDGGFNPTQAPASKGDRGFRQAAHLADRARRRCPWAAAGPGRATSEQPTLQMSSNQRNSNRLTRTPVTNVVNPSQKTTIISEKALRLTTFVTTGQKATRKTLWIDDVCNNTRCPVTPTGSGGARLRCGWATAGTGRASRRRAQPHISHEGPTGVEGAGGHERAWLRRPWAIAGPGRASRRRAERSSRRGRRAGGPPPTGTQSSPAHRTARAAPATPVGPQAPPKSQNSS